MNGLTARERAFQEGLDMLQGAAQQGFKAYEQNQQAKRDRALQALNLQNQLAQTGMEITPEVQQQVSQAVESGEYGSLGGVFSQARQGQMQRQRDLEAQKLQREQDRLAQQQRERELDRQFRQQQLAQQQSQFEQRMGQQEADRLAKQQLMQQQAMPTPQKKLAKLGAEAKSKVGSLASGIDAINKMEKSLLSGQGDADYITSDTPFIGGLISDNPFTENQRVLTEVVGRLQSGGAINKDEEKRFADMGPRPGDNMETQKRKLENQRRFLQNKLNAFGFQSGELADLGFEVSPRYNPSQQFALNPVNVPGMDGQAVAGQGVFTRNEQRRQRIEELRAKRGR
jgi:hypothetical protein